MSQPAMQPIARAPRAIGPLPPSPVMQVTASIPSPCFAPAATQNEEPTPITGELLRRRIFDRLPEPCLSPA